MLDRFGRQLEYEGWTLFSSGPRSEVLSARLNAKVILGIEES